MSGEFDRRVGATLVVVDALRCCPVFDGRVRADDILATCFDYPIF
jgi:hypothetical protein